ncbi:energy transducer TonB [Fontisphaera persica]|uniref:energy transducer TonB family protein n=1 Tax=Fontisphaera persica TaxID=2974023 RepID=UPI0024C0D1D2|nr:energy transducer TonB [Fontisphaera persica]WCJ60782.1 energy transducer TonB [Fontisphaera persica]
MKPMLSMHGMPGRRLWFWLGVSFAAHLAVIWLLGERPRLPSPETDVFRTVLTENLAPLAARLPDYDDPQVFALPSPRGFSGSGWLRAKAQAHEYHEWMDEQRWLPLPVDQLGQTFIQHVRLLTEPTPPMPRKAEPVLSPLVTDLVMDWAPARSRLQLEGALAARLKTPLPAAPTLAHKEVLKPTILELMVDERGHVFSALVLGESGLPAADELAVQLARQLDFQPAASPGLVSGRLVVVWQVQAATNTVPSTVPAAAP